MRKGRLFSAAILLCLIACSKASGQSMHFSQYYNAPALLNPANTGLMPEYDFRLGANYRNQWAVLPVPYNTISAYGDMKIGGNREGDHPNWLGLGGAVLSDKAGSGSLSLVQYQASLAYHLHLSAHSLLSFGGSAAYVQRSVNYDNLSFDAQWDGFNFNSHFPNGEKVGILKTNFTSVAAGFNLSFFPNEALYVKFGVGAANVNQPNETFYNNTNAVGLRPTINLDVLYKGGQDFIINPSAYYTTQNGAFEMVFGSLARFNLGGTRDALSSQLIVGIFDRLGDAAIGVVGYQYGGMQFMANYDFTMSTLAPYNASYGALEFSITYGGNYFNNKGARKMYSCPRF